MNVIIVCLLSIFLHAIAYGGFAAYTPITLSTHKHVAIKDIRIGDTVLCHDGHDNDVTRQVTDIKCHQVHECVCVILDSTHLITAYNQRFYLADQKKWKMAGYLHPGDLLLGESGKTVAVKCVFKIPRPIELYDLTVNEYHNFLVSKHGVIAHNCPPLVIGAAIAFGGGVEFTGLILGVGGIVLGTKGLFDWFKSRRDRQEWENEGLSQPNLAPSVQIQQPITTPTCTFPYPSNDIPSRYTQQIPALEPSTSMSLRCQPSTAPATTFADAVKTTIADSVALTAQNYTFAKNNSRKKPKTAIKEDKKNVTDNKPDSATNNGCKEHHPNGIYGNAPYHHTNSKGNSKGGKSPAPKNGQKALDNSVPAGEKVDSKRRISVSNGEIVVLNQTQPGLWHGHVRQWSELEPVMKKTVITQGLTSPKGKIL